MQVVQFGENDFGIVDKERGVLLMRGSFAEMEYEWALMFGTQITNIIKV